MRIYVSIVSAIVLLCFATSVHATPQMRKELVEGIEFTQEAIQVCQKIREKGNLISSSQKYFTDT